MDNIRFAFMPMTLVIVTVGVVKGAENGHAQQYAALCAVLREAEAKPMLPQIPAEDQSTRAMNEIYDISNKTTSELSGINSKEARLLQIKVERAVRTAQKLFKKLDEAVSEAKKARGRAQVSLRKAIYGEDYKDDTGDQDEPATLSQGNIFDDHSSIANSCGGTTSGTQKSGKTLINDFYCLCAGAATDVSQVCANGVTQGHTAWTKLHSSNAFDKTEWGKVKAKCPPKRGAVTPDSIAQALGAFRAQLGRGAPASDSGAVGATLLGTMTSASTGCNGSAANQACVLYHKVLNDGGIPWENQMRKAQKEMRTTDEQARDASIWFVKLRDQESLLRDLYNETLFEVEHKTLIPASPGAKPSPADKSESIISSGPKQDGTSLSNALSPPSVTRFILPCTFLL